MTSNYLTLRADKRDVYTRVKGRREQLARLAELDERSERRSSSWLNQVGVVLRALRCCGGLLACGVNLSSGAGMPMGFWTFMIRLGCGVGAGRQLQAQDVSPQQD